MIRASNWNSSLIFTTNSLLKLPALFAAAAATDTPIVTTNTRFMAYKDKVERTPRRLHKAPRAQN